MKDNQVVFVNVNREKLACKNIRLNERVFRCDQTEEKDPLELDTKQLKFKDVKNQDLKFKEKSQVVIKLNKQRDLTPL